MKLTFSRIMPTTSLAVPIFIFSMPASPCTPAPSSISSWAISNRGGWPDDRKLWTLLCHRKHVLNERKVCWKFENRLQLSITSDGNTQRYVLYVTLIFSRKVRFASIKYLIRYYKSFLLQTNPILKIKNWLSASHTRARRVPYPFLVFVVIAAKIIHHPWKKTAF